MTSFAKTVLRPVRPTCEGWDKISVQVEHRFRNRKIFNGVPLIVADMPIEACEALAPTNVMLMPVDSFDQILSHFRGDHAYHSILSIKSIVEYVEIREAVVDLTKIKYVKMPADLVEPFLSLHMFDKTEPPVIFAGPVIRISQSISAEKQGADGLWVGMDNYDWDTIERISGIRISQVDTMKPIVDWARHTKVICDLCCATPGDVAKAFILGADFVVLCKTMADPQGDMDIREVIAGLQCACAYIGAPSLSELYSHGNKSHRS